VITISIYKTCRYCGASLDAGELCDCSEGKRPCPGCGSMLLPGERCICEEQHPVIITHPGGGRTSTRANGNPESIIQYYRNNTSILSVFFTETGKLETINRQEVS
jgi:hypothetical protein